MNKKIYNEIKILKDLYKTEGFLILGIFGSYVRDEETDKSDVDILYEINEKFLNNHIGWESILRLEEIKSEIENKLNLKVDIADKNALNKIARKYIIPEVLSV
ncbi:MAG: nucleotidyltransferase domain-containing protein [Candidatus Delongbacteria bacterium]|jgi:predicted nucleotidyltransferase|nr:nucleotidyltransferase domain-containing protein [Candidatus Delongbacteria bacterium]